MSCPSWQWHRTGSRWSPVRTLPVAPLWCDLGFVPNSRGNKAAANLRPCSALLVRGRDTSYVTVANVLKKLLYSAIMQYEKFENYKSGGEGGGFVTHLKEPAGEISMNQCMLNTLPRHALENTLTLSGRRNYWCRFAFRPAARWFTEPTCNNGYRGGQLGKPRDTAASRRRSAYTHRQYSMYELKLRLFRGSCSFRWALIGTTRH